MHALMQRRSRRGLQRGLSLVEMMVGVAVGLFIVAGAAVLASSQLVENRRLLLETQVQQDLRAAADIITREVRRAGYTRSPENFVWSAQYAAASPVSNGFAGVRFNQGGDVVSYSYERPGGGPYDYGYQLVGNTIKQRVNTSTQDLTDRTTLKVTDFTADADPAPPTAQQLACPRLCADGTQACWPTLAVKDAIITIKGEAASDSNVKRTLVTRVRLRNDAVKFNVPSSSQVCP